MCAHTSLLRSHFDLSLSQHRFFLHRSRAHDHSPSVLCLFCLLLVCAFEQCWISDRQLVSFKATMGNVVRFRLPSSIESGGFTSLLCFVVLLLLFVAQTHTLDCACLALCVLLIPGFFVVACSRRATDELAY